MRYLVLLLLVGCTYNLPYGMVITEVHYSSSVELAKICGEAQACVYTDQKTYCEMHLPLAANGEPLHREHEITHCAGRLDPPKRNL